MRKTVPVVSPEEAQHLIENRVGPLPAEWTPLLQAQGRVLTSDIRGPQGASGPPLLQRGMALTPSRIALLASFGKRHAMVYAPARVAIVWPGTDPDDPALYPLLALVAEAGGLAVPMAIGPKDDPVRVLQRAAHLDVVLISGSADSPHGRDLRAAAASLGQVEFAAVAQTPAGDFSFATVSGHPVFGLPDDPAGLMVAFECYVRPALRRMLGHQAQTRPRVVARMSVPVAKEPGRVAFVPAQVDKLGPLYLARPTEPTAAGMAVANGFLLFSKGSPGCETGAFVETILLEPQEICGMACLPVGGDTVVTARPSTPPQSAALT